MPIKIPHDHMLGSIGYYNTEVIREARKLKAQLDELIDEFTNASPPKPPHHMAQFNTTTLMTSIGARDELIFFARRYGVTGGQLAGLMNDPGPLKTVRIKTPGQIA